MTGLRRLDFGLVRVDTLPVIWEGGRYVCRADAGSEGYLLTAPDDRQRTELIWTLAPGVPIVTHWHPARETLTMLSGGPLAIAELGRDLVDLTEGEEHWMPPYLAHSAHVVEGGELATYRVVFEPALTVEILR